MQSGGRQSWQDMRSSLTEQLLAAAVAENVLAFHRLVTPVQVCWPWMCSGQGDVLLGVSLGGLGEIKPCGRRNTDLWQAEIPGLGGHPCAMQDAGSLLAPREAAVAPAAFPGVQRNPYHPPQMEGRGLKEALVPPAFCKIDWLFLIHLFDLC